MGIPPMPKSKMVVSPELLAEMLIPHIRVQVVGASIDGAGDIVLEVEGDGIPDADEFNIVFERRPTIGGGQAVFVQRLQATKERT